MTSRVVVYTRVSKRKRGGAEAASHAVQEKHCRQFAEQEGWTVIDVLSDTDSGWSRDPLPARDSLLGREDVDLILVHKGDRISRHTEDLKLVYTLPPVFSLDKRIDTRGKSAAERKAVRDALSDAQYDSELRRERVMEAQTENLAAGKWQGGMRPFGYQTDDNLHLEPDGFNSEGLRLAAKLLIKHRGGTRAVADALNDEGYTRPAGGEWFPQEVRRYLSKPELKGEVTWAGHPITVTEPVLDEATWQEVQRWLAKTSRPTSTGTATYWLSGLVDCPCGGNLHGKGRRGSRNQPQYGCSRNRPGEAAACSYTYRRYWDRDQLEEQVWQSLIAWLTAAEEDEANWPFFPEVDTDDEELLTLQAEVDALSERASIFHDEIVNAQADLYDPEKPNATEEVIIQLKERQGEIIDQLIEAERRLQTRQTEVEAAQARAELRTEADRLKTLSDPLKRRETLLRAGLRVALWDEPVEYAGHTLAWRWTKA